MHIIPANINPNKRPSNEQLSREGFIMGIIVASIIGLLPIAIEAIIAKSLLFIPFMPLSFLFSLILYVPYHLYKGFHKKKQFIASGGDSTGITLWMFGSMGGQLLKDGTWQWKKLPPARDDYYSPEMIALDEETSRK